MNASGSHGSGRPAMVSSMRGTQWANSSCGATMASKPGRPIGRRVSKSVMDGAALGCRTSC